MGKINVLDSSVYNQIAAGEVVERPASIVKELMENAIDAGADNIIVEIANGGRDFIQVTDNGSGIEHEDMRSAFLPHATSKIRCADDLFEIATLGFRGEALASIAAVSRVTLQSKTKNADIGEKITVEGGKITHQSEIAANTGTTVIVKDLFYNTPARAKFLKKSKQEEGEITNLIVRYILIHPEIAIKYTSDHKIVFQSLGSGLKDAIYTVYGKNTAENIITVSDTYKGITVTGYAGKPTFTKPNRTYQTVSLNGRYILNQQIAVAVNNAYSDYLMKRTYPFYILNIACDKNSVDVNVHPNKTDVRFENPNEIFSAVFGSVSRAITRYNMEETQKLGGIFQAAKQTAAPETTDIPPADLPKSNCFSDFELSGITPGKHRQLSPQAASVLGRSQSLQGTLFDSGSPHRMQNSVQRTEFAFREAEILPLSTERCDGDAKSTDNISGISLNVNPETERKSADDYEKIRDVSISYHILGQLFNTYILMEYSDRLLMIDQHAAHERLLYDRFMQNFNRGEISSQPKLFPEVVSVAKNEVDFINERLPELNALGFEIEPFGEQSFKVSGVPAFLTELNVETFINDVLAEASAVKKLTSGDLVKEKLMQKACKAAIKAGDTLSDGEILKLLEDMAEGKVLQCPHGRPIIHTVKRSDIEKWFKRIV